MSVPAPPYGSFAPARVDITRVDITRVGIARVGIARVGIARIAFGMLVTIGLLMYAAWLAIAGVTAGGGAIQHIAAAPPARALPAAPTPKGSTVAFDQVWTSSNGNTIIAGEPKMGLSDSALHPGSSVIRVAVTLTNNDEKEWSPVFTTFGGTLNRATLQESNEGDWQYSAPIVPRTSVTLSKVFLGGPGQFTLAVKTPQGVALFTGQV